MSGKPKNEIMTPAEMQRAETRRSRLYSQTSDHGMVVAEIVSRLSEELANMPQKIDLRDTQRVSDVVVTYTAVCAQNGTIPNKIGLCRALGLTRQGVDWFLAHHADEPSATLLQMVFDSFAEAMTAAGLAGAVHPIYAIFVSKAVYGFRDTIAIEPVPAQDPLGEPADIAAIISKYNDVGGLPD